MAIQSGLLFPIIALPTVLRFLLFPILIGIPTGLRFLFYVSIRYVRRRGVKLRDEESGATAHPATCTGEKKSQCWACDGIICTGCKVKRNDITAPRTTHHVTECYAVCTTCYLTKWSSQPSAEFLAAFHPTDLSKQHAECGLIKASGVVEVELC